MKKLSILALAVILLMSFVVMATAQDKVVKKVADKVEKTVKGEKAKCPHSTAKCSETAGKPCCSKGEKVHIKNAKKDGECCSKATADCKTKCEGTKAKKGKK
ncbi:hypothetical protein H8E88_34210 [candidate division KSB1 bacterium]|nr:hypothetical protein [candidate division KSB1 bacterium]